MKKQEENIKKEEVTQEVELDQTIEESNELEILKVELAESKDKYLRLYSEFDNFRKRTSKEKIDLVLNATEGLVVDLLPVVDDFQRALEAIDNSQDIQALKEGVDLIYKKFYKTLENNGLKVIEAKGQAFDVDVHDCVTQFPAGDDKKGLIIEELEKGYFLNNKVIRHTKVVVGN